MRLVIAAAAMACLLVACSAPAPPAGASAAYQRQIDAYSKAR
jgi:hypothetical protein